MRRFARTRSRREKPKQRAVVVAAANGKIKFADATARRWFSSFFGRPHRAGFLPRAVTTWLGRPPQQRYARSLVMSESNAQLYLKQQESHARDLIILLLELIKDRKAERGRRHRELTVRERQVMFWVRRGKSNAEIGAILGISSLTVGKHLERIYPKLGVENRTAASNVAFD